MSKKNMKVIIVEPEKAPQVKVIDGCLETYQKIVGGYIECVYPFEDNVGLICNEEGKLEGLPLNRALRDSSGHLYDIIAGTFIVIGLSACDFTSLTDEQVEKYSGMYKVPEVFVRTSKGIAVLPLI